MATISLESAIRTCKVDTSYANKVESDRFLNPDLMVCPLWTGVDTVGREVCPDSYWTKRAGCNSAEDRVMVENSVSRPQYMEYINLSAQGIDGSIYGDNSGSKGVYGNSMPWNTVGQTNQELQAINKVTGNFGLQFGANTYPGCNYYPYEQARAQEKDALSNSAASMENYLGVPRRGGRERFEFYTPPMSSQQFAQNQNAFRQQQAFQQGFIGNDFRNHGGF